MRGRRKSVHFPPLPSLTSFSVAPVRGFLSKAASSFFRQTTLERSIRSMVSPMMKMMMLSTV